jgi:hypothetical protein
MLKYLDNRYQGIIGHKGLLRYVNDFPYFHQAMEREMQRPNVHYDVHNNPIYSDGLLHNPIFMFGIVDCSLDGIHVLFAGPAADFEFAPRKEQYQITQGAFYSGYKHFHSNKVETLGLPNGISFMYGPVAGRGSDITTVRDSGLDDFIRLIQQNKSMLYMAFGDLIYNAQFLTAIRSCYEAHGAGVAS